MAESFAELRAAAIDGRAHNVYYRQHELEALHQALLDHASEIKEAIAADYDHTPAEIAIELDLAFTALKQSYDTLQPAKSHEEEYLLASGKDAPTNKVPAGIVYIEPCMHTLFFSVIAPLSAAIAAGNCVILLLENNLRTLTSVLRQTLQTALHPDTFAISSSPIRDNATIPDAAIKVWQNCSESMVGANHLNSHPYSKVYAIVDRTSDVKSAARELVAARFAFGGVSPYAPDLILVNEFVKQEFSQAVADESRKMLSATAGTKSKHGGASRVTDTVEKLRRVDSKAQIISQETKATVVELVTRRPEQWKRLGSKVEAPVMAIHTIKSLDDAIDFIGSADSVPALAAYHFGNPQVGKYLAQFVDSRASFINHIPRELLVGPAHPATYTVHPATRYSSDMFEVARPGFIEPTTRSLEIASVMSSADHSAVQKVLDRALSPLATMKRKPGGGVGFFEQGFLIHAGMLLTITISATAAGTIWLVRNGRIPSWRFRV